MELCSIDIKRYKNLRDCHIDFSDCGRVAVLAGVNGSGKSNFLEAVALVYHRFVSATPGIAKVGECRLRCVVSGAEYDIFAGRESFLINGVEHSYSTHRTAKLIVVYSGEFNRLLNMGFADDLDEPLPIRNVVLLSAQSYQLLLLTKILMGRRKIHESSDSLLSLPKAVKLRFAFNAESVNLNEPPEDESDYFFREVLSRNGNTRNSYEEMQLGEFNQIMRDANLNWDTIDATTTYFALTQLTGDRYSSTGISDLQIVFERPDGSNITSDDLSEGEKWLAMYDAIYSCLADKDTLVLLDEPDAYIHEAKKRDFISFVESHSAQGIFTVMTTHSPNIINAIGEKSLFGFTRDKDDMVSITLPMDRILLKTLIDDRMSYFSDRPIILFEGVSDLRLVSSARNYFVQHCADYRKESGGLNFDFFSMGSADNMIDAYRAFHQAFPLRRIFIALDHDDKGKKVLCRLVQECGLQDITSEFSGDSWRDAVFLLPRPNDLDEADDSYVIEDYLPSEYIQDRMQEYMSIATRFSKVNNCRESIKTEIRKNCNRFGDREWQGFKPLIDFISRLPN